MSNASRASYLLTILSGGVSLLLATVSHAQDAVDIAERDLLTQREQLQRQLTELETTLGRHNPALVEVLSSLADSSMRLNLYSEASTLLDRTLQIQRLNLGLFSAELIPLIRAKMDTDLRAGDWSTVNNSIEHLRWLLIEKSVSSGDALIDSLIRLGETHLQGVLGDTADQQAFHYQQAFEITYLATRIRQQFSGAFDPRLVDLNYSLLKQFYLQSAAVERADDTAYALRAVVPGSKWVRPRRIAQSRYYRAGLRLLDNIREVIAQSERDPAESLAMVDLYEADWHLLFDQARAEAAYRNAFGRLREANVDPAELELFFARPKILPIPTFHRSVSSALTDTQNRQAIRQVVEENESQGYLSFQEWFNSMSAISSPIEAPELGIVTQEPSREIRLRFRLDSLNEVSRWAAGRYRTNISVAEGFEILEPDDDSGIDMQALDARLELLHFRPRLENGIASPFEGTLLYQVTLN